MINRLNNHSAKTTEVWTVRNFASGQLMLSPVIAEMKTRMFTHNSCVHVKLGNQAAPDKKLWHWTGVARRTWRTRTSAGMRQ